MRNARATRISSVGVQILGSIISSAERRQGIFHRASIAQPEMSWMAIWDSFRIFAQIIGVPPKILVDEIVVHQQDIGFQHASCSSLLAIVRYLPLRCPSRDDAPVTSDQSCGLGYGYPLITGTQANLCAAVCSFWRFSPGPDLVGINASCRLTMKLALAGAVNAGLKTPALGLAGVPLCAGITGGFHHVAWSASDKFLQAGKQLSCQRQ